MTLTHDAATYTQSRRRDLTTPRTAKGTLASQMLRNTCSTMNSDNAFITRCKVNTSHTHFNTMNRYVNIDSYYQVVVLPETLSHAFKPPLHFILATAISFSSVHISSKFGAFETMNSNYSHFTSINRCASRRIP